MKYCVSSRQPISVLRNADEIKVEYRDRQKMLDFIEDLPDKTYILEIPKGTENIAEHNCSIYNIGIGQFG